MNRTALAALATLMMFLTQTAKPQESLTMTLGRDAQSFHREHAGFQIAAAIPDGISLGRYNETLDILQQYTTDSIERPEFREAEALYTAIALIREGRRYVIVGPGFLGHLAPERVDQNSRELLIYGHEAGHHICRHTTTTDAQSDPWRRELEADQIAGALARALHREYTEHTIVTLESLLSAAADTLPLQGSTTHPDLARRQAAIRQGWDGGPACLSDWSLK
jgi:hypothetical protein